jgi:predicted transglutaminase-like cysteine proteinase
LIGISRQLRVTWSLPILWLLPCVLGAVMGQAIDREHLRHVAEHRYGAAGLESVSDWLHLIEQGRGQPVAERLERANQFVNGRTLFQSDFQVWQAQDYWATPLETLGVGRGDCEDFAIAKFVSLVALGIPQEQLRLIYVRAQIDGMQSQAHMVLGYYADPNGEPHILDNLVGTIEPASARTDLVPVFSFNAEGLWAGGIKAANDPTTKLSRWRDLMSRLRAEGIR